MLKVPLEDLGAALEGAVPSPLASASADGVPNVTYLSVVHLVDSEHVALSFQFFNKTKRNVLNNPRAQVIVLDPVMNRQFRLTIEYERTETEGPVYSRMSNRLTAVATATGMAEVFALRGADVYRVLECEALASNLTEPRNTDKETGDATRALASFAEVLSRCADLDALLESALETIGKLFAYRHAMVLVPDETGQSLYTIASRGYQRAGIGSEVRFGEGAIGVAAARKRPVRITNFSRELRMSRAVRSEITRTETPGEQSTALGKEIPLPGLEDVQSQQVVPLVAAGRVLGVLCVESPEAARFTTRDEHILTTCGHHLAAALALLQSSAPMDQDSAPGAANPAKIARAHPSATEAVEDVLVRYYSADDSVFVDGDYLIKGVAGRVLYKLLEEYTGTGRTDFTNKEIRLDPSLGLPPIKDNLETRLLLLRRRLEERRGPIRLERSGRGRLRLTVTRPVRLEVGDGDEGR